METKLNKVVLSVDTGFKNIGHAIVGSDSMNQIHLVDYGVWDMRSEHKKMNIRSYHGMKRVYKLICELDRRYNFGYICVENVPFARFNGRDATLALTNMFRAYAIVHDKEYSELHSTTVKKALAGHGRAEKSEVQKSIVDRFERLPDDLAPDVYDAIGVGIVSLEKEDSFWEFM